MKQSNIAKDLARSYHFGQYRRDMITPYISHVEAVANKVKNHSDETIAVAWAHDLLEDTSITVEGLRNAGLFETVIDAVILLTKKKGEDYMEYLYKIKANPLATQVKIADMLHNISDDPTGKQILKYAKGLIFLLTP